MDIKHRIQQAMDLRGVNQTELAKRVGVSPQAVQKWLSRKEGEGTLPRMPKLKKIAAELRVSESWLLSGVGSPDEEEADKERIVAQINSQLDTLDVDSLKNVLAEALKANAS